MNRDDLNNPAELRDQPWFSGFSVKMADIGTRLYHEEVTGFRHPKDGWWDYLTLAAMREDTQGEG